MTWQHSNWFFYFYWRSYHQFLHTTQNGDSNLFSDLGNFPKQFVFLTNVKTFCTYPAQRASAILAFTACFSWQISRFLRSLHVTHLSNWNHTYSLLLFNSKSYSISCIAAQRTQYVFQTDIQIFYITTQATYFSNITEISRYCTYKETEWF